MPPDGRSMLLLLLWCAGCMAFSSAGAGNRPRCCTRPSAGALMAVQLPLLEPDDMRHLDANASATIKSADSMGGSLVDSLGVDDNAWSKPSISAPGLLKRFGVAYILCSLCLSACSFGFFFLLVSSGVDLKGLGIALGGKSERLGTIGVAYLLHKAASPLRFPPTVALTMAVCRWRRRWVEAADRRAHGKNN